MHTETIPFQGFITLTFADQVGQQELGLGMAGFLDLGKMNEQFDDLTSVPGASAFTARKVVDGRKVAEKPVSAELVEALLQAPIAELIQRSRKVPTRDDPELERAMGLGCAAC